MNILYLAASGRATALTEGPLDTLITLCLYDYCSITRLPIVLVNQYQNEDIFPLNMQCSSYTVKEEKELPWQVRSCKLPVFVSENYVTTGLCGVLRQLTKFRSPQRHVDEHPEGLLGFRSNCLQAPNEMSVWTKFCEVEIVETTKLCLNANFQESFQLPPAIIKFEKHLSKPLRLHNVYKIARKMESMNLEIKNVSAEMNSTNINKNINRNEVKHRKWKSSSQNKASASKCSPELLQGLEHCFSEGPYLTLADIVLYTCYSLIFQVLSTSMVQNILPKTITWFEKIQNSDISNKIDHGLHITLKNIKNHCENDVNLSIPQVDDVSLYKCDPKRHNPRKREFTKHLDVNAALSYVINNKVILNIQENTHTNTNIAWSNIPLEAKPEGGHLPNKRVERKTQQLENLAQCVMDVVKDGCKVVDFCCGSGHLGILLAYLLPNCTIILLENKEESLRRASVRVDNLKLKNVYLFQCNIDYFIGKFDVGVALHACGIATDLVLEKCIERNASFVVCPCCYGSLHPTERIRYPRSQAYSDVPLNKYLCICHAADQTHINHPLQLQGTQCMAIIDSDRAYNASENGYNVTFTRIKPLTCTPKNMLLIGTVTP